MKKVYICAPLEGNVLQNLQNAKRYANYALQCGTAPVVPHFYALCREEEPLPDRELDKEARRALLWFCDEIWVFGDEMTDEMRYEIMFCKSLGIRVQNIRENDINKLSGGKRL